MIDNRVLEAKAIIGLAWSRGKRKNLTLHKPLPPLTNYECFRLSKDMRVSYRSVRQTAPRKADEEDRNGATQR